jgi:glycosyltransferase involved in cell wall biosynthesis
MDLLQAMLRSGQNHEFVILLNELFPRSENEIRSELRNLVKPADIIKFPVPRGCAGIHQKWELTRAAEVIRENFIADLNPDVVHVTSLIEGLHEDVVTSIGRTENRVPTAATFYDLIPLHEKKAYLGMYVARTHYFDKIRSLSQADALLAISQYVADEAHKYLPNFAGKVTNIRGGVAPMFKKLGLGPDVARVRSQYGLTRKVLLYTASFDQRKNQTGLIEAFSRLPASLRSGYQLAFVGGGNQEIYDRLLNLGASRGLGPDEIRFLGRVSDADLVQLYNICSLFVFPPKMEGMGMPPLEAMSCGAPVIGSSTSSIPEVIGWDNALFDPNDPASLAKKLEEALSDPEFARESIARAPAHLEQFRWEKSASAALQMLTTIAVSGRSKPIIDTASDLKRLVKMEDLLEADVDHVSNAVLRGALRQEKPWDHDKKKIGWVSSWAARCGIASYSMELVKGMSAPPVIFGSYKGKDQDVSAVSSSVELIRCWEEGKEDPLAELADAIEAAGVEILHVQFNYGFFDFNALSRLILDCVGRGVSVFMTLHSTMDQSDEASHKLSYLVRPLSLCTKLFVHSKHDLARLANLGLEENVALVPLGAPAMSPGTNKPASKLSRLATYGFALPGKGLVEMIEAFALMKSQNHDLHLRMVNANYGDKGGVSSDLIKQLGQKINELDLVDSIELCNDYLPEEKSLELLSEADIVVYPYSKTGESGSAAVRAGLVAGPIVAVTPLPIFDDVADCVYPLPGCSPREIANGLTQLIAEAKMGSPLVSRIISSTERLRSATAYTAVGLHIEEIMRELAHFNVFEDVLHLERDKITLVHGEWDEGVLRSKSAGVLCYGPYEPLEKGVYRIAFRGCITPSTGVARAYIADLGRRLHRIQLENGPEGTLGEGMVYFRSRVENVEIVIETPPDINLSLEMYSVSRRW